MNGKKKLLALTAVLAGVLILAGVGYRSLTAGQQPPAASSPAPAESAAASSALEEPAPIPAPDFTVLNAAGEEVSLSDYIGKPIVLNFWATWCGPCKSELPDFDRIAAERDGEVEFMMINLTDGGRETEETVTAFLEQEGYTFPVYYDTTLEAAYLYGASSIPLTMFIDAEGYVLGGYRGAISGETLEQTLDMLLEE